MANPEHVEIVRQGAAAIAKWREANPLGKLELSEAELSGINLLGAHLTGANLVGSDLVRADLKTAWMTGAWMQSARISGADLRATVFRATILDRTDFTDCVCGATVFGDVDLSGAKGLETVRHEGPSVVGVDTLFKSKGNIPREFLRGTGVPEVLIEYLDSLTKQAIDFYSCFISYSTSDKAFSDLLHADLQKRGVRCWYFPKMP